MPRPTRTSLSQPVFREPVFNETKKTIVPSGFLTPHPSDKDLYASIEHLLKEDVVSFDRSRAADSDLVQLAEVYGAHGQELITQINKAEKIIFHALGDSGASNVVFISLASALPLVM